MFKQMWVTYLKYTNKSERRKMKFIFPQNYDFKNKILGFIDYTTAIIDAIWCVLIFVLMNLFNFSINLKIFIFIVFTFPVALFSIVGFNGENIINVCYYLLKYMIKPKVLLYKKQFTFDKKNDII